MVIEIHGAGYSNKGAELMLRTVVAELAARLPGVEMAIDPSYGPRQWRSCLGLLQLFPLRSHVGTPGFSRRLRWQRRFASAAGSGRVQSAVRSLLLSRGCVSLADVHALIDVAGFAYSDQWGPQPTKDFAELTSYYRSRGRRVILLPQAFGPFDARETREAMRLVVGNSDLVFARDAESFEHVRRLAPEAACVFQAPDITLFHGNGESRISQAGTRYACIVPNIRLLDQGAAEWSGRYQGLLVRVADLLAQHGVDVRIPVYDTSGPDLRLAERLVERVGAERAAIVDEPDSVALGKVIGASVLVVGSRYHSLVAALSKAVPVVALGWAHKYRMLLEDFGCGELMVSHDSPTRGIEEAVARLLDERVNSTYRNRIARRLESMRSANRRMWQQVVDVLASADAAGGQRKASIASDARPDE